MAKVYWTFEHCKEVALKCKMRSELASKYPRAYRAIRKNKWYDELCNHMGHAPSPHYYWTIERCKQLTIKYKTIKSFRAENKGAYNAVWKNKWQSVVFAHMENGPKPRGYWTRERCAEAAKTCKTRTEFNKKFPAAKRHAKEGGFYEEICKHMKRVGNKKLRLVYVYEFPDKVFYVGLTCNEERRDNEHNLEGSPVYAYMIKSGLTPKRKIKSDYIPAEEAANLEGETHMRYMEKGWTALNGKYTGGLGKAELKWTFEACKNAALICKTKKEFMTKFMGAYQSANENGWLQRITKHMIPLKRQNGYWSKERCIRVALKCKTLKEFRENHVTAYGLAIKNKWLNYICKHMERHTAPGYWSKERCLKVALKCKRRTEFRHKYQGAYNAVRVHGWEKIIFKHMEPLNRSVARWTKDKVLAVSKKYSYLQDFRKHHESAYNAVIRNGWKKLLSHLKYKRVDPKICTYEKCKQLAALHKTRTAFIKGNYTAAWRISYKNGWLDDFFPKS